MSWIPKEKSKTGGVQYDLLNYSTTLTLDNNPATNVSTGLLNVMGYTKGSISFKRVGATANVHTSLEGSNDGTNFFYFNSSNTSVATAGVGRLTWSSPVKYIRFNASQTGANSNTIEDIYVLTNAGGGGGGDTSASSGAGSATPGGADTDVQFNDGGVLGGDSNFVFTKSNGRVGIGGIAAPTKALDITESGADTYIRIENTDTLKTGIELRNTTDDKKWFFYRNNDDSNKLKLEHSDGGYLVMKPLGQVGIGTTDPGKLLVVGEYTIGVIIRISGDNDTTVGTINRGGGLGFSANGGTIDKAGIFLQRTGYQGMGDLLFAVRSGANDTNVQPGTDCKMIIKEGGNVGVGTLAPSSPFSVSGVQTTSASREDLCYIQFDKPAGNYNNDELKSALHVYTDISNTTSAGTEVIEGYAGDFAVKGAGHGVSSAIGINVNVSGADNNYPALFNTGNVGINTTAPDQDLEINNATGGTIRLTFNDDDGSAATRCDLSVNSNGNLSIDQTNGDDDCGIFIKRGEARTGTSGGGGDPGAAQLVTEDYNCLIGQCEADDMYFYWQADSTFYSAIIENGTYTPAFTGQHACYTNNVNISNSLANYVGYIVVSNGEYKNHNKLTKNIDTDKDAITINDSLPIIEFSLTEKQKNVFGVISNLGNKPAIIPETHSYLYDQDADDDPIERGNYGRIRVNSLGEGALWVCNYKGNLENGDYITTSPIEGIGMLQKNSSNESDDILRNFTVAKITMNCTFIISGESGNTNSYECKEVVHNGVTYKMAFVGCTYHCG